MSSRFFAAALLAALAASFASPASAAVIVITQSKAVAGNVTPGDAPGFPVELTQPGSYRLDANLTVPANQDGIVVRSEYVNIDMNGFRLWGFNTSGARNGRRGILSSFGLGSVRNGAISGFKNVGIRLVGATSAAWVVEDMQIFGNGAGGIQADSVSNYHRFTNNSILRNSGDGVTCGDFCHMQGNIVADNSGRWHPVRPRLPRRGKHHRR